MSSLQMFLKKQTNLENNLLMRLLPRRVPTFFGWDVMFWVKSTFFCDILNMYICILNIIGEMRFL